MSPAHPGDVFALLGKPVAGNPTEEMIEAAFAAAGVDARYVSIEVEPAALRDAIRGVRAFGLAGFHVTAPHKVAVVELLDELTAAAEVAGAVNCVKRIDGRLVGDNTDGRGFLEALRRHVDPAGARVAVLGAGGAAHAIVAELALAGAGPITIVNRSEPAAAALAERVRARTGCACEAAGLSGSWAVPAAADVIVQATTVGMGDADARLPLDWTNAGRGATAADVVIDPPQTAFLREARACGLATIDGRGMLVEQAVIGFRWWTGADPDAAAMRAALEVELAGAA